MDEDIFSQLLGPVRVRVSLWGCGCLCEDAGVPVRMLMSLWGCWCPCEDAAVPVRMLVSLWGCWCPCEDAGVPVRMLVSLWDVGVPVRMLVSMWGCWCPCEDAAVPMRMLVSLWGCWCPCEDAGFSVPTDLVGAGVLFLSSPRLVYPARHGMPHSFPGPWVQRRAATWDITGVLSCKHGTQKITPEIMLIIPSNLCYRNMFSELHILYIKPIWFSNTKNCYYNV